MPNIHLTSEKKCIEVDIDRMIKCAVVLVAQVVLFDFGIEPIAEGSHLGLHWELGCFLPQLSFHSKWSVLKLVPLGGAPRLAVCCENYDKTACLSARGKTCSIRT